MYGYILMQSWAGLNRIPVKIQKQKGLYRVNVELLQDAKLPKRCQGKAGETHIVPISSVMVRQFATKDEVIAAAGFVDELPLARREATKGITYQAWLDKLTATHCRADFSGRQSSPIVPKPIEDQV